jgi:hypothetical protein
MKVTAKLSFCCDDLVIKKGTVLSEIEKEICWPHRALLLSEGCLLIEEESEDFEAPADESPEDQAPLPPLPPVGESSEPPAPETELGSDDKKDKDEKKEPKEKKKK